MAAAAAPPPRGAGGSPGRQFSAEHEREAGRPWGESWRAEADASGSRSRIHPSPSTTHMRCTGTSPRCTCGCTPALPPPPKMHNGLGALQHPPRTLHLHPPAAGARPCTHLPLELGVCDGGRGQVLHRVVAVISDDMEEDGDVHASRGEGRRHRCLECARGGEVALLLAVHGLLCRCHGGIVGSLILQAVPGWGVGWGRTVGHRGGGRHPSCRRPPSTGSWAATASWRCQGRPAAPA